MILYIASILLCLVSYSIPLNCVNRYFGIICACAFYVYSCALDT